MRELIGTGVTTAKTPAVPHGFIVSLQYFDAMTAALEFGDEH
jgi:hypothetical protein